MNSPSKKIILFLIFFLSPNLGFPQQRVIESKYFTLEFPRECELVEFAQKINVNYFLQMDIPSSDTKNFDSIISKTLDALYLEVSDILDIHIYSYHGKIKVYPNKEKLKENVFRNYPGQKYNLPSVYIHSDNAIHISLADLTLGMLAHEIAHAIISHYFVVPPPAKVQEVLAGYVEYSIRKSAGTLPSR